MILGGLWHGTGWTFIVWGLLQGILLSINHMWRQTNFKSKLFVNNILSRFYWTLTFLTIVISWVIFRSSSLENSFKYIKCFIDEFEFGKFFNPFINSLKLKNMI